MNTPLNPPRDDKTRVGIITRAKVIRDIATQVARDARGRLTFEEAEAVVDSVMPSFEVIAAAHALTLAAEDTSIIRPRLVTAMRELGEEGIETIGIIVSYAGSTMDLFPGEEWSAIASCDPMDDSEGTDARGVGATCRAALEQCASEVFRMETVVLSGDGNA